MKKKNRTITIGHNGNGYYYRDGREVWHCTTMIVAFRSLLDTLTRVVTYAEKLGKDIEYRINISRTLKFHKSSD